MTIPAAVHRGMYLAAWARAEHCPVYAQAGVLDLYRRYEPTDELYAAFARGRTAVAGSLGWAVPVQVPDRKGLVTLCTWPASWCAIGAGGRN